MYGLEKDQDSQYLNRVLPVSCADFTRGLAITDNTIFIGQSRMSVSLPAQLVYQTLVIPPDLSLGGR